GRSRRTQGFLDYLRAWWYQSSADGVGFRSLPRRAARGNAEGYLDGSARGRRGGGGKSARNFARVPGSGGAMAGGDVPGEVPAPQPRGGAKRHNSAGRGRHRDEHTQGQGAVRTGDEWARPPR
ncbi:unnamed protein product, partial [Laminaria digitata]